MHFRRTVPSRIFIATDGGAGLAPDVPCARHGNPSLSFHLFSQQGDKTDDIGILLPACAASRLLGAALAFIKAFDGEAAADEFMQEMLQACDEATRRINAHAAEQEAARAACCEAGFRTQGREHTCRPDTSA